MDPSIYYNDRYITINKNGNEYTINHEHTHLDDQAQLNADKLIALNRRNPYIEERIKETEGHIKRIKNENPDSVINQKGYSLGGTVAIKSLSNKYINNNTKAVNVKNPGTNPLINYFADINTKKQIGKINITKTNGDLISSGFAPGKVKMIEPTIKIPSAGSSFISKGVISVFQTYLSH